MIVTPWAAPPAEPILAPGELHLWRFSLDCDPAQSVALATLLNAEERGRGGRLLDPRKGERFVVGRGRLRTILGRYLHLPPATLQFTANPHGKPALMAPPFPLAFNLAHSHATALLAVTGGNAVGVDLEMIDLQLDGERLAARFFTLCEQQQLQAIPPPRRRRAFYRLWTRKEALLKGLGTGFAVPCASIGATLPEGWQLRSFPLGKGLLGAVAVSGEIAVIRRWRV